MRTAVFALGFAAGMVFLAAILWSTGSLLPSQALAAPNAPEAVRFTQPVPMPPRAQPTDAAPAVHPPAPSAVSPALGMPLAGVDPHTLQSSFAQRRNGHAHEALDIMGPRGTGAPAPAQGAEFTLFTSKPGGLTVYQFDDSRSWCYYYAHLDHYAPGLKEGMLLRKGDVLGYVGSTGDASPDAPHLHFAVFEVGREKHWWEGTAVHPLPLLRQELKS